MLSLLFHRDPAKTDIAYIVEASSDLTSFDILYDSRGDLQDNTDGDAMRILDTVAAPAMQASSHPRRFLRLRIELLD
ncbi:MAG: hypothetical protein EA425_02060 [Puniceicoccaceae bacterium]|nr:MAG: hypothetical protein EA425_02060 [Puniceicoccaceae bacterium]